MNPYTSEALQKLRELPIEEVAQSLGMNVRKHKSLCPFHEDRHPSLSFHVRNNTFKCFACDAHGGVIDLAMHVLGKDFKEACLWLSGGSWEYAPKPYSLNPTPSKEPHFQAERFERFFQRPYLNPAARAFLFEERKLHPAVARWCRLNSYTDRNGISWLQIPYFDINGKLIGVQNRRLRSREYSVIPTPRFKFPRGSSISIYNLPILKLLKGNEELWIAEGASDCWALLSSGRKAIAIPSATLLRKKDLDVLKTHSPWLMADPSKGGLHMSPDNDAPGLKLFQELKKFLPDLTLHPLPEGIKDYSEYYVKLINQER